MGIKILSADLVDSWYIDIETIINIYIIMLLGIDTALIPDFVSAKRAAVTVGMCRACGLEH